MSVLSLAKRIDLATPRPIATVANPIIQRLWFSTTASGWSSLAVVPVDVSVSAAPLARTLTKVGHQHGERSITYLDAQSAQLVDVHEHVLRIRSADLRNSVIVAVDPPSENPSANPIVSAASGVILVIKRGESQLSSVRKTLSTVGHDRVVGIVTIV
jgi:hypothetical protein